MGRRAKLNTPSFLLVAPLSTDSIFKSCDSNLDLRFVLILNYKHGRTAGLRVREIQYGAIAKSYRRKGFLIYEEMREYLTIYEEAVNDILIWFCNCSNLNFLIYEENLIFFFYQCSKYNSKLLYFTHFFSLCKTILRTSSLLYSHFNNNVSAVFFAYNLSTFELWKSWIYMEMILPSLRTGALYSTAVLCQLTAACTVCRHDLQISRFANLETPFHHSLSSMHWKALYCLLYCPVRVDFALDLKVLSSEMDPAEIMLIRQFLRNLQTRGTFIAAFYKWKTMDDNQKSLLGAIGYWSWIFS